MKEQNEKKNFLKNLVSESIEKVEELSSSKTIVGEPIVALDGTTIIPINKVSIGYVVGGGEININKKKEDYPTCGGSGGGVSITPVGFIVNTNGSVQFINVENKTAYQTILNLTNAILSKLNQSEDKNEKD